MIAKAAEFIRTSRERIVAQWEREVRSRVAASEGSIRLTLRNNMPMLVDELAVALEKLGEGGPLDAEAAELESAEPSLEHGRFRASMNDYTAHQVLLEFAILRQVVTRELAEAELATSGAVDATARVIEDWQLLAIESYSETMREARESLARTLAHDVKSLLGSAMMGVKLCQSGTASLEQAEAEEMLEVAEESISDSLALLDHLVEGISSQVACAPPFHFEDGDFARLARRIQKQANQLYHGLVEADLPREELRGRFDASAIRRAIENLLSHAVQRSDASQPVRLEVEEGGEQVSIRVSSRGKATGAKEREELEGILQGGGSDAEEADGPAKGWGRGLSLARRVTRAHGGEAGVEFSDDGKIVIEMKLPKRARDR